MMMRIRSIIQYVSFLALLSGNLLFGITVEFEDQESTGNENEDGLVTVVFLGGNATGYFTYEIKTSQSTATPYGESYADFNQTGESIWVSSATSYVIDLNLINDNRYEDDETIVIEIEGVSDGNFSLGDEADLTHEFTIDSEDALPSVAFRASSSSEEEGE